MRLITCVMLAAGLFAVGCERPPAEEPPGGTDLIGAWEVIDEPAPPFLDDLPRPSYSIQNHRYFFDADSTVRIYRPRPLGPASAIYGDFAFRGDTLVIRSEFDAGYYIPRLAGDTLLLDPVNTGRPLTLIRIAETMPPPERPLAEPPGANGDYTPPSDLPPEDMPRN